MLDIPTTKKEALGRAEHYKQEAYVRLRSMSIGGQQTYDALMLEADKWRRYAETVPDTYSMENK
jgi:hypothetical protein